MSNLRNIKGFYFNSAEYRLEDDKGNKILLKIDYAGNKYDVKKLKNSGEGMKLLVGEAGAVAFDLLRRKRNNNRIDALNGKK